MEGLILAPEVGVFRLLPHFPGLWVQSSLVGGGRGAVRLRGPPPQRKP